MDFYEKLKSFLRIPARDSYDDSHQDQRQNRGKNDIYSEMFGDPESQATGPPEQSFNMFTDPMEIHRYFEQEMINMMRNFGFHGGFSDGFIQPPLPEIESPDVGVLDQPESSDNLRDLYLKPGYENAPHKSEGGHERMDQDIDGKLNMGDVISIFDGEKRDRQMTPYEPERPRSSVHFFSKSSSIRTVIKPDGTTEIHKTVRDHEGNEESTVTKQMGDKEYTIIKRKDKTGQEEIIENLVNLDENEAKALKPLTPSDQSSWLRFWKF